jgi:uncharacterized protein with PQ loop repeat
VALVGVVGAMGVVLSVAFAWPQALSARRADDVTGVSGPANVLLLLTATTWTLYSLAIGDLALIVANGVCVGAAATTLEALHRRGHLDPAATGRLVAAWGFALTVVIATSAALDLGAAPVGVLAAALGISMSVPQAWRALRGHGVEGVSLTTYLLLMAVMATWLVYGLLVGDPVVWVPNVIGLVVVAVVVAVLVARREPDTSVMFAPAPD